MQAKTLIALAALVCLVAAKGDMDSTFVNKKIYDYKSLKNAFNDAVRRNAKIIVSCEDATCPFSKLMTRHIKKELKNVKSFDAVMLRIEK